MVSEDRQNRLEDDIRRLADKLNDTKATERVHSRLDKLRDFFQGEITRLETERLTRELTAAKEQRNARNKIYIMVFGPIVALVIADIYKAFGE